jgi:hypothetical protein
MTAKNLFHDCMFRGCISAGIMPTESQSACATRHESGLNPDPDISGYAMGYIRISHGIYPDRNSNLNCNPAAARVTNKIPTRSATHWACNKADAANRQRHTTTPASHVSADQMLCPGPGEQPSSIVHPGAHPLQHDEAGAIPCASVAWPYDVL